MNGQFTIFYKFLTTCAASRLTLETMKLFQHTITIVCIIALAAFAVACSVISLSAAEPRTVPGLELTLMPIPAGSFDMGSPGRDDIDRPPTSVTISQPFYAVIFKAFP
jgi:formylglycine-generating enzyme required for sulfatase activity